MSQPIEPAPPALAVARQRRAVVIGYVGSIAAAGLDGSVVNVMLPTIASSFGSDVAGLRWAVLGLMVMTAITTPVSAWLSARLGERRLYLLALALFGSASLLSGLSVSVSMLLVARCLQGAAGGLLIPVAMSLVYRTFPAAERARLLRVLLLPIAAMPTVAPLVGGFLADAGLWRLAFLLNVPVVVALLVVGAVLLSREAPRPAVPFDLLGFLLIGVASPTLLLVLSNGREVGWSSPLIPAGACFSVALLVVFVVVELRRRSPLLNLRVLQDRVTATSHLLLCLASIAWMGGVLFTAPLALQQQAGLSPSVAGIITAMSAVGVAVSAQTLGRLFTRIGARVFFGTGQVVVAAMLLVLAFSGRSWSPWLFGAILFVAGLGYGMCTLTLQVTSFVHVEQRDTADASTLTTMNRGLSAAVGVAFGSAFVAGTADSGFAYATFGAVAVVCSLIALVFLRVPSAAAADPSASAALAAEELPVVDVPIGTPVSAEGGRR